MLAVIECPVANLLDGCRQIDGFQIRVVEGVRRHFCHTRHAAQVEQRTVGVVVGYAEVVVVHRACYGNHSHLAAVTATDDGRYGTVKATWREVVDNHLAQLLIPIVLAWVARQRGVVLENAIDLRVAVRNDVIEVLSR